MSEPAGRIARLALLAYPREFRREYGDEIVRCMRDMRRHGDVDRARLAGRVAADVLLTAPRMRLETLMHRSIVLTLALGIVALIAAVAILPVALVALAAVVAGAAVVIGRRHDGPLGDSPPSAGWRRCVLWGVASFAVGSAILIIDGGELSEPVWALWALTFVAGAILVGLGIVLAVSERSGRRAA